ncbi:MAG TPA: hypothetical protein GXZ35_07950 [Acholeplasmataceae bacterium]|nr:hypothetical protein [Acholeplasmataceae bacterium]
MNIALSQKIVMLKKLSIEPYPYSVLKIIPFKTGYSAKTFERMMNTIAKYNKPLFERFELRSDNRELIYRPRQPLCYEVLMTPEKITYYFVIPSLYKNVFINKAKFIFDKCDIVETPDYLDEFYGGIKQSFRHQENSLFSLNCSDHVNLNDSLLVLHKDLIQPEDKLLVQYQFLPLWDWEWKDKFKQNFNRYKSTGIITNPKNVFESLFKFVDEVIYQLDLILNGFIAGVLGESVNQIQKEKVNFVQDLSADTKHKTMYDGFKTSINLYVKSNPTTTENIIRNLETIYKDIDGDNTLKPMKPQEIKKQKKVYKFIYGDPLDRSNMRNTSICNTKECVQFIKTPSEKMLIEFEDILEKINLATVNMPGDLFKNGLLLGELKKGSTFKTVRFGSDVDSNSKPLVYISPQSGGKSSFMRMYGIDAVEHGESIFAFDTIDGKTIRIIRDYLSPDFPEEKIIVLDFRDNEYAFPLLWNEISDHYYQLLNNAKDQIEKFKILEEFGSVIGNELKRFIDTFQSEDSSQNKLTPAMRSVLTDLAQLVFMNKGNFGMIKDCIWDVKLRHQLLKNLQIPNEFAFAKNILQLDSDIQVRTLSGVETRLNLLMENATLKKYFSLETDKKLDFAHWANNGYCVLFRIPEEFSDILVTFLTQKLWLAIKSSRYDMEEKDRPMTHLLIDEPNRFPTIMCLLMDHIIASRKWHLRFVFFIHNMNIFRIMGDNLKTSGASFIMLPTSRQNFEQVSEFYKPFDFDSLKEVEKLIAKSDGKRRYALCSLHYKNSNYPCIVQLPLPIEMRREKVDRSYLNEKCAKEYGISQREYYENMFNNQTIRDDIDNNRVWI